MRSLTVAALLLLSACPGPEPRPPKLPNVYLIEGNYQRHPPDGETAIHFDKDHSFTVALNHGQLETPPYLGEGAYKIDGETLTFTASRGMCADAEDTKIGTYKVVLSKVGIRFTKLSDTCERRSRIDGQTWWRLH